jgi:hypothetical protein
MDRSVGTLQEAGYAVVPVNPDLVARRRGPARKKGDPEDSRILCLLAMDRHSVLRPLIPHREVAAELRAIARDDERASRDERLLLNRLRADLIAPFPEALADAGEDLGAPTFLQVLGVDTIAGPAAWRSYAFLFRPAARVLAA